MKNTIVVETSDAILIANKENSDYLKSIVSELDSKGYKEGLLHKKIYRPWGSYLSLVEDKRWQVKRIEVTPGSSLSLQMHHHRAEHWTVVEGTAKVEIDDNILYFRKIKALLFHLVLNIGYQILEKLTLHLLKYKVEII